MCIRPISFFFRKAKQSHSFNNMMLLLTLTITDAHKRRGEHLHNSLCTLIGHHALIHVIVINLGAKVANMASFSAQIIGRNKRRQVQHSVHFT